MRSVSRAVSERATVPPPKRKGKPASSGQQRALGPMLHRSIGNARLANVLQVCHTISQSTDPYKQEADRVADEVLRMPTTTAGIAPAATPQIQQVCPGCEEKLERQRLEEEEEPIQTKPLAPGWTIQRQGPEEEEELVQAKTESDSVPEVTAATEAVINALPGRGRPLPESVRNFMEPRFNADFRAVRVHTDAHAHDLARSVNAQAFTVGNNIVFGAGRYAPESEGGKHLLAHELTHVVQQQGQRKLPRQIQRWLAEEHGNITKSVIDTDHAGLWSHDATVHAAYQSGEMDLRGCNYLWYLPPKIPVLGPIVTATEAYYRLSEDEAPNHGEANRYLKKNTDPATGAGKRTWANEARMNGYTRKAAAIANADGLTKPALIELGLALHVGQDRGAHDEGLAGQGHDKPGWKPDDPAINARGHQIAKKHTKDILDAFYAALTGQRRRELKALVLGSLAGPVPTPVGAPLPGLRPLMEDPRLRDQPPLLYMGVTKGMFMKKSGLPVRLGGIFTPLYTSSLVYRGDRGSTVAFDQQIGLRLLRITPRIYVDVFGGGALGVGVNDRSLMAGISSAVQVTYTGKESDYTLMLNKIWDLAGDRELLVVGVGGHFEETSWFK